jgi:hypothetical protein
LRWIKPQTTIGLSGYAIHVQDANGADSTYRSVAIALDSAIILVKDPESKRITLATFGDAVTSCWTPSISATADVGPIQTFERTSPSLGMSVWPNPTYGSALLRFDLTERSFVHVEIFDLLGHAVTSPIQNFFDPGEQTSSIDLNALEPGSYYCRISAAGTVETVRITIER